MPPRKKTGRAAAEAAYANLLKENTALVGDVGEAFDAFVAKLEEAAAARERYEEARAAAVKGGAVTNDQLDQMGYKKTSKLPTPPAQAGEQHQREPAACLLVWPADQRRRAGAATGVSRRRNQGRKADMSPIELLAMESQEQHRRYHELFGLNPVGGDGLRDIARRARELSQREREVRQGVINLDFSTAVTG